MDDSLLLALKVAASVGIGLLIGLEREWAHKEAGIRSFTIAALLGTVSWLVSPTLAFVQVGVVVAFILLVNVYALLKEQDLQFTTSAALVITNVLGMLVGMGSFFLAFTCAIVVTALLSWKTELVSFTSKITETEIRGALLLGFVTAIVYPLLPDYFVDPWKLINPRSIWLSVVIVSGLSFVNYVLLRLFGARGMRYSAILGGLVNSAAMSALLGDEFKNESETAPTIPSNFLLADLAMILRNGALVAIFSWLAGPETSIATAIVLGPMIIVAGLLALFVILRVEKNQKPVLKRNPLKSPLALQVVLRFAFLFFSLTVVSGVAELLFGAIGFLAVVVLGALASAASSSVLVGIHVQRHLIDAGSAAIAVFLASLVGLVENVVIFYSVTHDRPLSVRLLMLSLPIMLVGGLMVILGLFFGWV